MVGGPFGTQPMSKKRRKASHVAHGVVLPHRWPPTLFEGKDGAMHPILIRIPLPGWKFLGDFHSIPIHSYGVMLGLSLVVGWYLTLGLAERDRLAQRDAGQLLRVHRALGGGHVARPLLRDQSRRVQIVLGALRSVARRPRRLRRLLGRLLGIGRLLCGARRCRSGRGPTLRAELSRRVSCSRVSAATSSAVTSANRSDRGLPQWLQSLGTFPHWPEGTLPHGSGSPAWVQHVQHHLLDFDSAASLPVHPTQIYESLVGASLLGLLFWVRKNLKFRGQVFLTFTFAYGVLRFLLEMIRDDLERGEFGPHIAEHLMISGGLLVFAIAYIVCMAPSIGDPTMRKMTQVIALVPPCSCAYLLLKPASFADQEPIQLSTSQWVALLTAVPAAIAYMVYFKAAEAHPDSALALNLDEFYAAHPEQKPGAAVDEEVEKGADATTRRSTK